uniref:Protein kinase domain-containing protein n=1 Tax=Schistosoma mansoni TaxID=6183 RepID=A0A3Q0KRC1_SCHMA
MCITGDHDTPFISPCHFLLDRKKSHLFNSTNNLSSNNCKQQKPIHNSALFPNICSSAKFITTERSGILIILFILLGDILCTTARFTHLSEKFQTVAEDKNSELVFLNSPASSSVFKPARFTRRTSKPSGKVDTRKTDMKTYLNKARRHLSFDGQMEIKFLSSELVEFICHRLPDPCARAAYLRQHVRHDLCFRLPLLYLLPYTDSRLDKPYLSEYKPGTCKGSLSHLIYLPSDSIFEQFLTPVHICERSLLSLKKIMDDNLTSHFGIFDDLLEKSFCVKPFDSRPNVTGECQCQECQEAYRSWFCATEFPLYYPLNDADLSIPLHSKSLGSDITDVEVHRIHVPVTISNLSTSSKMPRPRKSSYFLNRSSPPQPFNISVVESMSEPRNIYRKSSPTEFQVDSHLLFRLVIVQPCISWCTQVETVCPYLNPADPTSNGGEPAFLCDESHYHHSSRYQAVYWDVNTCESECCFGVSDSILLSVSIPDKKQYSTSTDIVLSYSSDVDKSSDNDSCSHLRDRCLHRFLSVHHSSLIAEFSSIVPDQTSSKYFNYDFNQSNRINSKNFSDYHSLSPALHKIDSISFRIILIISFTLHIFIWLHNIQVLLFQNFTSIIFLRYHHVTMTIMNTSLTSNDDNNTTDENTHYVSSSLSHSPTSLVSHPPLCLSDFTKHSNSCRPS